MQLKSGFAVAGAIIGLAGMLVFFAFVGLGWIMLGVVLGVGVLSYIIGAAGSNSKTSISGFGEFMRGWLIGLNAALNGVLLFSVLEAAAGTAGGIVVGGILGAINLIAAIGPVSRNRVYQGIIGWCNWFMPMSWLIVALGILFNVVSLLLHAVTIGKVQYLKVLGADAHWRTGTFFIKGGLIANMNPSGTAFNMGNFSFVDRVSKDWYIDHEVGHSLNLAAFGAVFHLVGAFDENATPRGENALSERIAESHDTGVSSSNIPMWAA